MFVAECRECKRSFNGKARRGKPQTFCSTVCRYAYFRGDKHHWHKTGRHVPKGSNDYITVMARDHPKANQGKVREHILVAERIYGGPLPPGAEVHHVNGNKKDNRPENLEICLTRKDHRVAEAKSRRLRDFGSLDLRRCIDCHAVKALGEFHLSKKNWDGRTNLCKPCVAARDVLHNARRKQKRQKPSGAAS